MVPFQKVQYCQGTFLKGTWIGETGTNPNGRLWRMCTFLSALYLLCTFKQSKKVHNQRKKVPKKGTYSVANFLYLLHTFSVPIAFTVYMTSITGRCRAFSGLASKDLTLASWKNLVLPNGDTKSPFWASTTLHHFICGSNVLESGSWRLPTISERGYLWNGLIIIRRAFSKLGRICILATVVFQKECAASDMYMYLHIRWCFLCMTISNAATYGLIAMFDLTDSPWHFGGKVWKDYGNGIPPNHKDFYGMLNVDQFQPHGGSA